MFIAITHAHNKYIYGQNKIKIAPASTKKAQKRKQKKTKKKLNLKKKNSIN